MDLIAVDRGRKLLRQWIEFGLDYRIETSERFSEHYFANEQAYLDRTEREYNVVSAKDFCDYFLTTSDIVRHAKDVLKMGVGPGRGSAAGSLLCYEIRITEINPMMFPTMMFERFIDPSRPDMPDIDLDFAEPYRIFLYATEKYGADKVAHIGNFMRYRGKTTIEDVRNAFSHEMSYADADAIKDLIVDRPDGDPRENDSIEDTIEAFPAAKAWAKKFPAPARIAMKLEGNLKGYGIHAAGMVISNTPITDVCAVYSKENSKGQQVEVIPYDKRDAEYLGILKLDVLGLTTALAMQDVVEMVPELSFEQLYDMPLDDQEVLAGFARGDVTGIFQFDGRTTRGILREVFKTWRKGDKIDFLTLADVNALSRPGALVSGMTRIYEKIEQGKLQPRDYGYDAVNAVLEETNRCLVYQEQVMRMGLEVAGMPGDEVGALRRIIGKKKAGGAFDEFYAAFRDGAYRQHGMTEEDAKELWDFMAASASYLFNIAHAISYAVIAYWAMYLKVHYPVQWYTAMLRQAKKSKERDVPKELMQDAVKHGILVMPPSLFHSGPSWTAEPSLGEHGALRAGFEQIPGVGGATVPLMLEWIDERRTPKEEMTGPIDFRLAGLTWKDMQYVGPKWTEKKIPCEPYLATVRRMKLQPDGKRKMVQVEEMLSHRKERTLREPASGVPGFGPTAVKVATEMSESKDPFGLYRAGNVVRQVRGAITNGDLPLPPATADADDLPHLIDNTVTFVGLVRDVKIIDVIEQDRKRTNRTVEEVKADMSDPHLSIRAKLICVDEYGVDVHVNISRFKYPSHAEEISEVILNKTVAHVVGKSREGYGPTISCWELNTIELEHE